MSTSSTALHHLSEDYSCDTHRRSVAMDTANDCSLLKNLPFNQGLFS